MRHGLKHGIGHQGHHRHTGGHHHLSAETRAKLSQERKGKKHPHKSSSHNAGKKHK